MFTNKTYDDFLNEVLKDLPNQPKMDRENVYDVINSERDYQESMKINKDRPDVVDDLTLGDTITCIQFNLNKATTGWYTDSKPYNESMVYLRKIAALCVQAMEKYGCEKRIF